MTDPALLAIFRDSCLDQLAKAETALLGLESAPPQDALKAVEAVFRAVHTVKGDAATLSLAALAGHCHQMETVLQALRDGRLEGSPSIVTALLAAFDSLKAALMSLGGGPGEALLSLSALAPWLEDGAEQDPSSPCGCPIEPEAVVSEPQDLNYSVSPARLDALLDRLGEAMQTQALLAAAARRNDDARYLEMVTDLERELGHMGKCVLEMRLLPFSSVTPRYRRMVRDLAAASGKDVALRVQGEKTEMDKALIEQLGPALVHLLRNAVRHGLETPQTRLMAGKPPRGEIVLDVRQDGREVIVTVADDGAGIDAQAVLAQAERSGLVRRGGEPGLDDALDLIFAPGLSTSRHVDGVSGRGVGLDAVRASIEELGGSVRVTSSPGRGTSFELRAPLSLSLLECLRVRVGEELFYFPMECVESCQEAPRPPERGEAATFALEGRATCCLRLDKLLGVRGDAAPVCHVVVASHAGERFGAAVDEVLGLVQVLVKPLDRKLLSQDCFLGAALGEEGEMRLILDPRFLARRAAGEKNA
ncbi:Chemotaxis protein CheA [Fundidesulfovibrio magnetotacticus]|uniref:histidine kinase n=1 Tax=Fundidesulfovibrio magnetotacticus TaxID=2730080 RepID=A0A6V8LYP3_9BACT|nr:ATP-binding protein [Fundidesulfovibrio magnetotacticus]GFK93385.1 Chemotaxis protein CheA [Fundidesulfovibrio magnetotacticus]